MKSLPLHWLINIGAVLVISVVFLAFAQNITWHWSPHLLEQAKSFLAGRPGSVDRDVVGDVDLVHNALNGTDQFPAGLLSGIMFVPLVLVNHFTGLNLPQGVLAIIIHGINLFLSIKLGMRLGIKKSIAIWLSLGLLFGSNYILTILVPSSYYIIHAISVLMLLLGLVEFYGKRRYWLIGIVVGFVVHVRYIALIPCLFFGLNILLNPGGMRKKLGTKLVSFLLPIIVSLVLLAMINSYRFGSPFDTGYMSNDVNDSTLQIRRESFGQFNPTFIPLNIYYYFINFLPLNLDESQALVYPYFNLDGIGPALPFASPIFMYIFLRFQWNKETAALWISTGVTFALLLMHFTAGWYSYGTRYIIDILPFWFVLLCIHFRSRSTLLRRDILLIVLPMCFSVFMIFQSIVNGPQNFY